MLDSRTSGLTYETYYGLKEKPFSLSSDSRFFYQSRAHAPAYDDLLASISRRESLSVLTGDIGTGKTTLCRTVLQNLDRKTFSAFVPDPFASRKDLLKVLLLDFGVVSVEDLTSGRLKAASRTELSYLLYEFLDSLRPLQAFAVVIIDEAQNLSVPLLEEIRILSDSDGRERQLQVVLVGQLELRHKLKLPEMRQVDQRVSVHCSLSPLGPDGVAGFIEHRLQIAGGSPDRIRFAPETIEAVYRVSGGVPRLINRICDRALHQGYLRRVGTIDLPVLEAAIPDPQEFAFTAAPAAPGSAPIGSASTSYEPAPVVAVATAPMPVVPAPTALPVAGLPQAPDIIDQWMMAMDEGPIGTGAGAAASRPAATGHVPGPPLTPARPERLIPLPAAPATHRTIAPSTQTRTMPHTRMQRQIRRWMRRIALLAAYTVAVPAAGVAGVALWNVSTAMWELSAPLLSPGLPPVRSLAAPAALVMPAPPAEKLDPAQPAEPQPTEPQPTEPQPAERDSIPKT